MPSVNNIDVTEHFMLFKMLDLKLDAIGSQYEPSIIAGCVCGDAQWCDQLWLIKLWLSKAVLKTDLHIKIIYLAIYHS